MFRQLIGTLAFACTIPSSAFAADPKVPPAKDPGLVPVAIVGAGIDYTDMSLAQRLARDGEGSIVGWDFVDNDIFPYSKDAVSNAQAKALLSNPGIELVPVRVDAADYKGVGGAASFLSRTLVRIVVVTNTSAKMEDWAIFTKAAEVFPKLLFVVPAGETAPLYPASLNLANVISVTTPLAKAEGANVAMAVPAESAAGAEAATAAAIALATALATCHASALGEGDGKAMKTAAIALAKQRSASSVPAVEACP
ncbi:MAG: hypothetical protein Q7T86_14550 [Hyphomicrobiaceae bacterium]|nr:hypothetical protein [Hyphomicrobiaceae bacterium]